VLFGRMFQQCVTSTEYEITTVAATVRIAFSLGTIHDARENISEWLLMFYIHQQLKAFIIRLHIVVIFCIAELGTVIFCYTIVKVIDLLFLITIL